jgi:hypothetical protein
VRFSRMRVVTLVCSIPAVSCDSPTEPTGPGTEVVDEFRSAGVLFTATAEPVGRDGVEVILTAANETDFDAQTSILGGNCMLRPRLYGSRGGPLVWSAFDLHDACQEPLRIFQLGGGDEESVTQTLEVDV